MESPASPAIDGDAVDEGIFDNEMDMEAAGLGVDDVDEEDINPSMAHTISEDDDIDEENYNGICNWQNFPPPSNSPLWRPNNFNVIPMVYFDKARQDMFTKLEEEIECILNHLDKVKVRGNLEGIDKAIALFFGPSSTTHHVFSKILPDVDYDYFARFIGAFFFASSWNSTYSQCCQETRMDTSDFCDKATYNAIWAKIENYAKDTNGKRSWKKFQDAFNETLTEVFVPTRAEMKAETTIDDDKRLYQYSSFKKIPIDEESGLSRQHHTRVNRKGFNW